MKKGISISMAVFLLNALFILPVCAVAATTTITGPDLTLLHPPEPGRAVGPPVHPPEPGRAVGPPVHPPEPGVDPTPFRDEINKLHSIELTVAAVNKRLTRLDESAILPEGMENHLRATARQMDVVGARMAETLATLPVPSLASPYRGQDEVVRSVDGIKLTVGGINDIINMIAARMGVDPQPFKIGSIRIIEDIDFHLVPIRSEGSALFQ